MLGRPRKRTAKTVGLHDAADLLGILPGCLHYRASVGKLPVVRYKPMRFRVADLVAARERMAVKDNRGSWPRPPRTARLTQRLQEALAL